MNEDRINEMSNRATMLDELALPEGLQLRVLTRLAIARRRRARVRLGVQSIVCFCSGLSLVPFAQYAGAEFYTSGFYEYASLIVSDRSAIAGSWREFIFSLIESLPSLALICIAVALVTLSWSLSRAVKNGRAAFTALPQAI